MCMSCRREVREVRRAACEQAHGRPMRRECYRCRGARLRTPVCTIAACVRVSVGRGLCATHYKAWYIEATDYTVARPGHGHWITVEDRVAIYERDGWQCQLCGGATSRIYDSFDPLSPTLDHLVPKSLGGTHGPENLQLAHAICNSTRGARLLDQEVAVCRGT